jgi:hypothetical protein
MKILFTPYPAKLAICVTVHVEPSFITGEKTKQNVSFIGINKDVKPGKAMQSFIVRLFMFLHYTNMKRL